MKGPWEAPKPDNQGFVRTERGYGARQGSKHQFIIDKYEQIVMAPLTREERRLFYPVHAWLVAWPFIGIGGIFAGIMLMVATEDLSGFVGFLIKCVTLVIGLGVMAAGWGLPILRATVANQEATKTLRDAREDAFEAWRTSGREANADYYDDDDDDYRSERQMQHEWYGHDNADLNWRDRELGQALGIPDGDTYKSNWL